MFSVMQGGVLNSGPAAHWYVSLSRLRERVRVRVFFATRRENSPHPALSRSTGRGSKTSLCDCPVNSGRFEGNAMELTSREFWTAFHGMILGAGFLLAFSGGFFGLWGLRCDLLTDVGVRRLLRQLAIGSWGMAILAWLAVLLGTYMIYPWYRAKPQPGSVLSDFPKFLLLSRKQTIEWHE